MGTGGSFLGQEKTHMAALSGLAASDKFRMHDAFHENVAAEENW